MIVQIVMFAILLNGGAFGAAYFNKRFEEILPLQMMIMMAVLYIFGLLDHLRAGVSFVVLAVVVLYVAVVVKLIKGRCYKEFIKRMITPAFVVFLLCSAFLIMRM